MSAKIRTVEQQKKSAEKKGRIPIRREELAIWELAHVEHAESILGKKMTVFYRYKDGDLTFA